MSIWLQYSQVNIFHITPVYPHNTFKNIPRGRYRHWPAVLLHQGVQRVLLQLAVLLQNKDYQLQDWAYERHLFTAVEKLHSKEEYESCHKVSLFWQMPLMSESENKNMQQSHVRL